ncbi:hypothetical protein SAMN05216266_11452 [Amycolatopsis marina]|uniref:DUF2637 domain-containing protein n=1 Tax=Amycolatopsis marina TaxID=490629 RepID=A0A1I1BIE6_9PSEU|nr:hypothetical protein SAMN05216266_11452 [Amycolatopsis marina]
MSRAAAMPIRSGSDGAGVAQAVTVIMGVVVGLTFMFGFGNILNLALRLDVPAWVAPLIAPAVDLSILGLLLGSRHLAFSGVPSAQLRPARRHLPMNRPSSEKTAPESSNEEVKRAGTSADIGAPRRPLQKFAATITATQHRTMIVATKDKKWLGGAPALNVTCESRRRASDGPDCEQPQRPCSIASVRERHG